MSPWIGRQVIIFGWGEEHEGELMSIDYVPPVLGIDKESNGGYMVLIMYKDGQFGTFSLSPECAGMRAAGTPPPSND